MATEHSLGFPPADGQNVEGWSDPLVLIYHLRVSLRLPWLSANRYLDQDY
jgi:hypothetical protein